MNGAKKILIHSNYHPILIGGIGSVVNDLAEQVLLMGHDLTIFCGGHKNTCQLSEQGWFIIMRKIIFKIYGAPFFSWGNLSLIRLIYSSDLIIYQEPFPSLWPAMFYANRVLGKKIIVLAHANPSSKKCIENFYSVIRGIVFRGVTLVSTSPVLMEEIKGTYSLHSRVIPLAIKTRIETQDLHGVAIAGRYVLSIGRFAKYKGLNYLIDAAALTPEVNYLIVGSGDQSNFIKKKLTKLNIKNITLINHFVQESEKFLLIDGCDFFVFPSTSRNEAFGIVQLEVMRAGKAIINTSLGSGVNFVAPDGICAITIAPRNIGELASAIKFLWSNPDISYQLGLRGRDRFLQLFTKDKFNSEWGLIIHSVLNDE